MVVKIRIFRTRYLAVLAEIKILFILANINFAILLQVKNSKRKMKEVDAKHLLFLYSEWCCEQYYLMVKGLCLALRPYDGSGRSS